MKKNKSSDYADRAEHAGNSRNEEKPIDGSGIEWTDRDDLSSDSAGLFNGGRADEEKSADKGNAADKDKSADKGNAADQQADPQQTTHPGAECQENVPADATGAADGTESSPDLKAELIRQSKDFAQLRERHLRLAAEYDNFRKRTQRERENLFGDHVAQILRDWLPVIDNLERAERSIADSELDPGGSMRAGINMVCKQAEDVLARYGVKPIECLGQPFDPELHEAMLHVVDESIGPSMVVEELVRGYRRDDRVIRHSAVKVAN